MPPTIIASIRPLQDPLQEGCVGIKNAETAGGSVTLTIVDLQNLHYSQPKITVYAAEQPHTPLTVRTPGGTLPLKARSCC